MSGIVVGVDGSGHSQRALEWAMKEAAIRHSPLTVVTVHEAMRGFFTNTPTVYPGDPAQTMEAQKAVKAEADRVLAGLEGPPPESVTVKAVFGFPVQELVKEGHDADMIVLGSRGAGGFTRLLLGSTASHVVQEAECPVVIVPHDKPA